MSLTTVSNQSHNSLKNTKLRLNTYQKQEIFLNQERLQKHLMGEQNIETGLRNSFQKVKQDMDELKIQLKDQAETINELKLMLKILVEKKSNSKPRLDQELYKKIKKNKKELVKTRILELIEKEKYSITEIKEIIVDKNKDCSKATFYRYLQELSKFYEPIIIQDKEILTPLKLNKEI